MTGDPKKFRFVTEGDEKGEKDKNAEAEPEEEGALCDVAPTILDLLVRVRILLYFCE